MTSYSLNCTLYIKSYLQLANGWEEIVARQALLAQWTLDQRKTTGTNTTIAPDLLALIKPTLKRQNETLTGDSNKG